METNNIPNNEKIVQAILTDEITKNWSKDQYNPYKLIEIESSALEYQQVNVRFSSTFRGYCIEKLERIENPYLLAHYLLKKEKKEKQGRCVEEKYLFHGTKANNINEICKSNFDWRLNGQSRGHKFGQGVSFSPSAFYSHHYGDVLLLVRVLIGKSTVGGVTTKIPSEPYDTTTNGKGTVYVKYEDDDYYPEYVIHYQSEFDFFEEYEW